LAKISCKLWMVANPWFFWGKTGQKATQLCEKGIFCHEFPFFILNNLPNCYRKLCFFRSVSPHSCLLATHLLRVRQLSRNLSRDARHKSSIRELRKKTNVNDPLTVSFPSFDKYFFMKKKTEIRQILKFFFSNRQILMIISRR
jgi:hypothetical protein